MSGIYLISLVVGYICISWIDNLSVYEVIEGDEFIFELRNCNLNNKNCYFSKNHND